MQAILRLFISTEKVSLSPKEREQFPSHISEYTIKILAQRKTTIRIILGILFFTTIIGIITESISYHELLNSEEIITTRTTIVNVMLIDIFLILIDVAKIILFFFSQFYWNDYKKSTIYTHLCGFLIVYLQLIFFFLPYTSMIKGTDCADGYLNCFLTKAESINIIISIVWYFIPNIFVLQATLGRIISLKNQYESSDLKRISNVLISIYIPLSTFVFAVVYQVCFISNYELSTGFPMKDFTIIIWILYTLGFILELIHINRDNATKLWVVKTIVNSTMYIMVLYFLIVKNLDVRSMIFRGLINYLILSILLSDFILRMMITKENPDSKINVFIKDINSSMSSLRESQYDNIDIVNEPLHIELV